MSEKEVFSSIIGDMKLEAEPVITKGAPQFEVRGTDEDVDHPDHYQSIEGEIEVIDIIESYALDFHLGNVIKYVLRADWKDDDIKDLKKALWYLEREIANREED